MKQRTVKYFFCFCLFFFRRFLFFLLSERNPCWERLSGATLRIEFGNTRIDTYYVLLSSLRIFKARIGQKPFRSVLHSLLSPSRIAHVLDVLPTYWTYSQRIFNLFPICKIPYRQTMGFGYFQYFYTCYVPPLFVPKLFEKRRIAQFFFTTGHR